MEKKKRSNPANLRVGTIFVRVEGSLFIKSAYGSKIEVIISLHFPNTDKQFHHQIHRSGEREAVNQTQNLIAKRLIEKDKKQKKLRNFDETT